MLFPDGDIRIAPLYDVASIAPYQSLAPRKRKPLRAALSIGGENRFGMLGTANVEKMVQDCGLDELNLDSALLCGQLARMAELVPKALDAVLSEAHAFDFQDSEIIESTMRKEITSNCHRTLTQL